MTSVIRSKTANIILNGTFDPSQLLAQINLHYPTYVADGAFNTIKSLDLPIQAVCGDFDSIQTLPEHIKTIHLPDQNYTDFEKILLSQKGHCNHFNVYGGSGGELDHFLHHLSIAKKYLQTFKITFFDAFSRYFVTDKNTVFKSEPNKVISIFPFPETYGLTSVGLKYPLNSTNLVIGENTSIRNEATQEDVTITLKSGTYVLFIAH